MISNLIIEAKKRKKYNHFHKKSKFSQYEVNEIVQKVKYNLPTFYYNIPQIDCIKTLGLDMSKSLYVEMFENLNFSYIKSLYLAQKIVDFNLVILHKNDEIFRFNTYPIKANFIDFNTLSKQQKEALYNLNINCQKICGYAQNGEDKIEVKNTNLVAKNIGSGGVVSTFKDEGNFVYVIENYLEGKFIFINNLINQKKYYFLTNSKVIDFKIEKIKNTNNFQITAEISLKSNVKVCMYFGEKRVKVRSEDLQEKVQNEIKDIFNFKIETSDSKLDFYINKILPELAQKNLVQNEINIENVKKVNLKSIRQILYFYKYKKLKAEEAYLAIKNLLFEMNEKLVYFKKVELENYRLEIMYKGNVKNVEITCNGQRSIVIAGVAYKNCSWINLDTLEKVERFQLSF